MLTKQKEQHFVPEQLGKSEIGLPPAGAKTSELIAKNMHTKGLFSYIHVLRNFSYDQSVRNKDCSG